MEDAVDYLTWTFFYRRLVRNPSYYGLQDPSPESISKFLSSLVEGTLYSLQRAQCVTVDDGGVSSTTLGRIAAYYYLSFHTIHLFGKELGESEDDEAYAQPVPFANLLSLLSQAAEYRELPVRHNEDRINEEIRDFVRYSPPGTPEDPQYKASLLLQHHFARLSLPISDYVTDLKSVLDQAIRIVQAMVDVAGMFLVCLSFFKYLSFISGRRKIIYVVAMYASLSDNCPRAVV
jgi:activating signal cointegrator complex subunit 3